MMKMRLNKYISQCGIASRRKADELIESGRISVNGKVITSLGFQIDEDKDVVKFDGEKIKAEKFVYYLLNKPKGVVTTTLDEKNRKTVIDLIETKSTIFPVGRLDFNTTGVLLLTNDGDFANKLTHPSNKYIREYEVKLNEELTPEIEQKLLRGIILDGRKSRFITMSFPKKEKRDLVIVSTEEGRNHFVKKMFDLVGLSVKKLDRIKFGDFTTLNMRRGEYRKLTSHEIKNIKKV
ncbi:MAG: pseudouridine synthase [Melioribacteraceae bacterium]|nr:pseudouridine synthase [Melioribacteraceae bacterium]